MKIKIIGELETQRINPFDHNNGGLLRYDEKCGYFDNINFNGENHGNKHFNNYINCLFNRKISVLDLGCGGGKFIHDVIEDGNLGIGLEGFQRYEINKIAEWSKIPENLKIINIAKSYQILNEHDQFIKFDIITSWEVLEHLFEDEIDTFLQNIYNHSHQETFIFLTISFRPDNGHFTIKPLQWWLEKFQNNNFRITNLSIYMPKNILVRNCPDSHFIVIKKNQ